MPITRTEVAVARRQAAWLARMEPWLSLGYSAQRLSLWLGRMARAGRVRTLTTQGRVQGILVISPDVLLGDFIALVAVQPFAANKGHGRALVESVARRTFAHRRWLYVSSDAANRTAAAFYRKLGFVRVGRLPDMVSTGHTEILWRLGRPPVSRRPIRTKGV